MKKFISLILALSFVFMLVGCVEKESEETEKTEIEKGETNPDNDDNEDSGKWGSVDPEDVLFESSAYYEYAVAHDDEFWEINKDWRDDRNYYYLADVDHDGMDEMVVEIGCGVGIYKEIDGEVKEIFCNTLPESSGSVHYWLSKFEGKDYISYNSASSSEYMELNKVSDGELELAKSSIIIVNDYTIDDIQVSEEEYRAYVESVEYPSGMSIDGLK